MDGARRFTVGLESASLPLGMRGDNRQSRGPGLTGYIRFHRGVDWPATQVKNFATASASCSALLAVVSRRSSGFSGVS